ncbi:hypothetical protein Tco_0556291 [Tanacetum coccineum]
MMRKLTINGLRFQPLPEVQGKGKEKVIEEQAARDLLTLQTAKKKSPADQFIFQRRTPTTTKPFGNVESPSLDAELAIADSQAGSDPGKQDEGQAGSNPSNAAVFQPQPSHVVHVGPNLKPMDLAGTQNSQLEDQFFVEKPQEEELEKTNAESEVQSMVTVPIHQDTSLVPPMTNLIIDLIMSQADSPTVLAPLPTSTATTITITTITTLPPPPPQP